MEPENNNNPPKSKIQSFTDEVAKPIMLPLPISSVASNCPQVLYPLLNLDQIFVKQDIELAEVICGCDTNNSYQVKDEYGRNVYQISEDTDCICRNCCGKHREFIMNIRDFNGYGMVLKRGMDCFDPCCCPCLVNRMEVTTDEGRAIGTVLQEWSFLTPKYVILDSHDKEILRIRGTCCTPFKCCNAEFKIYNLDGVTQIGTITKKWSGLIKEAFSDADNFKITFPIDLNAEAKGLLLAACILIDFMYFENRRRGFGFT